MDGEALRVTCTSSHLNRASTDVTKHQFGGDDHVIRYVPVCLGMRSHSRWRVALPDVGPQNRSLRSRPRMQLRSQLLIS